MDVDVDVNDVVVVDVNVGVNVNFIDNVNGNVFDVGVDGHVMCGHVITLNECTKGTPSEPKTRFCVQIDQISPPHQCPAGSRKIPGSRDWT